jgi:outer membrane protein OmpA-like peptidoglycan-associated protein
LSATVRLVDNKTKQRLAQLTTGADGSFELAIPRGGNFGVTTEKSGYLFNSLNFTLPEVEGYEVIETDILLERAEVGSKVVLKNLFFDLGKADLKAESFTELENISNLLRQNEHLRLQVNGHTDNTGHEATNLALSLERAESVIGYLVKEGIEKTRLEAKGFGSAKPIVSNDDELGGRQINRRTEIEVIRSKAHY